MTGTPPSDRTTFLRYSGPSLAEQTAALSTDVSRVVIGRALDATVSLPTDPEVSRLHAVIEWLGDVWTISDDGLSTNGTFVNDERLTGRRRLFSGDRIRVGTSRMTFVDLAPESLETRDGSAPSVTLTPAQRAVVTALCRPYAANPKFANPATNQQIAAELGIGAEGVKRHLQTLFAVFEISDLPQNQKRAVLAQRVMALGLVAPS